MFSVITLVRNQTKYHNVSGFYTMYINSTKAVTHVNLQDRYKLMYQEYYVYMRYFNFMYT